MSVSREWNSLKASWIILLLALAVRIFLGGQFLLTPDEAFYWQAGRYSSMAAEGVSPFFTGAVNLSTSLFGHNEVAVRLPAALSLTLASIYMTLLAASMFSWHTALHVTLLTQGILLFNLAALLATPYSLLLACWSAVCYHSSQGMNDNRTEQWLFAGFWYGTGLVCHLSMILLLPSLILCFVFIRPYRKCLLFGGPWFGFLLALCVFLPIMIWQGSINLAALPAMASVRHFIGDLVPDFHYSIRFIMDQAVLLTPVALLLILAAWLTGSRKRHLVKPDVQFLTITSFPYFLLYLIFPVFEDTGPIWTATAYVTAIILIAGMHSSTRSSFKGRPNRRWILCLITAYCITVPLVLQIAYPAMPLSLHLPQTRFATSGWDQLSSEMEASFQKMPDQGATFIFSMDTKLASELDFYLPPGMRVVSLDRETRTERRDFLEKEMHLAGTNGIGVVSTRAALEMAELLFEKVELEREIKLGSTIPDVQFMGDTLYVIRGFNFRFREP